VTVWYQWRADEFSIFVGFAKGKRTGKLKALLNFWVERVMTAPGLYGFLSEAGFLVQSPDPDQITDAREAQNRLINDPKWKKEKERELLVDRWQGSLRLGYDFSTDGTVKVTGVQPYTSNYRFVDDDHIEINIPAFQFQPAWVEITGAGHQRRIASCSGLSCTFPDAIRVMRPVG
jgi:hypothetical protein